MNKNSDYLLMGTMVVKPIIRLLFSKYIFYVLFAKSINLIFIFSILCIFPKFYFKFIVLNKNHKDFYQWQRVIKQAFKFWQVVWQKSSHCAQFSIVHIFLYFVNFYLKLVFQWMIFPWCLFTFMITLTRNTLSVKNKSLCNHYFVSIILS